MIDIKINNGLGNPVEQTVYYIESKYPNQKPRTAITCGAEPGLNGEIIVRIYPRWSKECGIPNAPEVKYTNAKYLYNTLEECQAAIDAELDTIRRNYTAELNADALNNDRIYSIIKFCIDHDTRKDGADPISREIALKYLTTLGIEV